METFMVAYYRVGWDICCPRLKNLIFFCMPPSVQRSRPPLARMLKIHDELQRDTLVNCSKLVKDLEVCRKTVVRDIAFMRDQLDLPIEYDGKIQAYRYTHRVNSFPTVHVTEGELLALLVAQRALEQYRGTPFHRQLEVAFAKLSEGLKDRISFSPADELQTVSFKNIGFDLEKRALRTFALPRITNVVPTKEKFVRAADFSPQKFFANALGVLGGDGDYRVVIRFSASAADLVREREWHESQEIRDLPSGELELRLRLGALAEVERWILGWGASAQVVEPSELRNRLHDTIASLAANYSGR